MDIHEQRYTTPILMTQQDVDEYNAMASAYAGRLRAVQVVEDDAPELAVGHDPQQGRVTLQSCTTGERLYSFTPEDARIMASLLRKHALLCDPVTGVREESPPAPPQPEGG